MSSLQPRPGHWLLRCPFCKSGFTDAAGALVCRNGHSFDLAREGYVNLTSGRRRRSAASGDSPTSAFAVADLWADWPVRDAAVDLVVSIFAPKNFPETARVLRRGGWFALAHPGPEHLTEFRDRFGLLRQNEESPGRYSDMATRFVGPSSVTRLHHRAILDPAMVRAGILMGPNARHVDPSILDVGPHPLTVTFDINVLFARKTERKS